MLINDIYLVAICLQETMLNVNTPCPREYSSYRTKYDPEIGSNGGCLIYVRNDIPQIPLILNTSLQSVAVQIAVQRKYTLCSIYLPPNDHVSYEELIRLIHQLPKPFLLLGDFNSRHPMWGDILANAKGNLIASVVENEDVALLNSGAATHYHVQTGTMTHIDLSITSSDCYIDFEWNLKDSWHTSDHSPIIINSNNSPPVQRSPRWCLEKANWEKFRDLSDI